MKNYVRIQSTRTITVTPGLQAQDVSNPDAHVPDRLRVSPIWPKSCVQIKEGTFYYPAEIVNWNTVKSLVNDKVFTIGEFSDTCDDQTIVDKKEELFLNKEEREYYQHEMEEAKQKKEASRRKRTTLSEVAG